VITTIIRPNALYTLLSNDELDYKSTLKTGERSVMFGFCIGGDSNPNYTVSFDTGGGSDVSDQILSGGSKISTPDTPTKDYDVLEGWYTDPNYNVKWDFNEDVISGDMVLYAKYQTYLETLSWKEIAVIADTGNADDYFDIGDTKIASTSNGVYIFRIVGFNQDDLVTGKKAGITFSTVNVITANRSKYFSEVSSVNWEDSDARGYLQGYIYDSLPDELQSVIIPAYKKSANIDGSLNITEDNIFAFSESEIFGTNEQSYSGEGNRYRYWVENPNVQDRAGYSLSSTFENYSTGYSTYGLRSQSNVNDNYIASVRSSNDVGITRSGKATLLNWMFGFCIGDLSSYASISYSKDGGSTLYKTELVKKGSLISIEDPGKPGYTFSGWYTDAGYANYWNTASDTVSGDITLYAKWEEQAGVPASGFALEEYSWDMIKRVADVGLASSYWSVGDEKAVTIDGVVYTLQIYDFNHDELTSGSGNAGITFGLKEVMPKRVMNATAINTGGWAESDMRAYLNGVTTDNQASDYSSSSLYSSLPDDLQSVISEVNKYI
jgi:uncharacterized repeat protein (TIGR02543 family)